MSGRRPDRIWTRADLDRLREKARALLLEGKTPPEVEAACGNDVFPLAALRKLAWEAMDGDEHWLRILNDYRATLKMGPLKPEDVTNPLQWLRRAGVEVSRGADGKVLVSGLRKLSPDRRGRCLAYVRFQKPWIEDLLDLEAAKQAAVEAAA